MKALRLVAGNVLVAALLLLALEAGLRLAGLRFPALPTAETADRALWLRDDGLGWVLRPGAEGVIGLGGPDEGRIRVNSLGLRGEEFALAKRPGVVRVLALGDSYVLGVGVDEKHLFTTRLQDLLGPSVEVINMGINGYSTDQELLQYRRLGRQLAPDAVVLMMGDNDFDAIQEDFVYRAYYKPFFELDGDALVLRNSPIPVLRPSQKARLWLGQHSYVWNAVRSRGSSVPVAQRFLDGLQVEVPRAPRGDTLDLMTRLVVALRDEVHESGARLAVFNTAHRAERTTLFQALRPRLREAGVLFLGLEGHLGDARGQHPERHWDFGDDYHWNIEAHALAAEVVANFLRHHGFVPPAAP